jgi:hypothetical protein
MTVRVLLAYALLCLILGALVLAGAAILIGWTQMMERARAHGWYELACCSGSDCAPVEDGVVVEKSDGIHVQGWGVIHPGDPRLRWSRDDRDHICARPGKLICIYRKPSGM